MALVPIRIERTSKPPIGTPLRTDGHWSVQGLIGAWAFNDGGGRSTTDSFSQATTLSLVNNCIFVGGMILCGVDGQDRIQLSSKNKRFENPYTVTLLTGITRIGTFNSGGNFFGYHVPNGVVKYGFVTRGGGDVAAYIGSYTGNYSTSVNTPVVLGLTYNGISINLYANGLLFSKTAKSDAITYTSGEVFGFCEGNSLYDSPALADFALSYNISLTSSQIALLSVNPWQIYEPETVWINVGGGGETALLGGAIYGQSQAQAQLSTAISLAAQAAGLGSIAGQLAGMVAAAQFAGVISGAGAAQGNLTTAVLLAAAANGNATAQAALSTALHLAAQVAGASSAQAVLSTAINLLGVAAGHASASGQLATPSEILAKISQIRIDTKTGLMVIGANSGKITIN